MAAPSKIQEKPVTIGQIGAEICYHGLDIKPPGNVFEYFVAELAKLGYRKIEQIFPTDGSLSPIIKTVVTLADCITSAPILNRDGSLSKQRAFSHRKTWRMRVVKPNGIEVEITAEQMTNSVVPVNHEFGEPHKESRISRAVLRADTVMHCFDAVRLLNPRTFSLPSVEPDIRSYMKIKKLRGEFLDSNLVVREWDLKGLQVTGVKRKFPMFLYHKGRALWPYNSKVPLQVESEFLVDNYSMRENRLKEIPVDDITFEQFSFASKRTYLLGQWLQQEEALSPEGFYEKMREHAYDTYDLTQHCIGAWESGYKEGEVNGTNYRCYFTGIMILVEHYKAKAWKAMEELNRGVSAERRAALITNLALYQIKLARYDREGCKVHALVIGVLECGARRAENVKRLRERFEAFNWPKITQENQEYLRKIASLTTQ